MPSGESHTGGSSPSPERGLPCVEAGRRGGGVEGTVGEVGDVEKSVIARPPSGRFAAYSRRATGRGRRRPQARCPSTPSTRALPASSTCRAPAARRAGDDGRGALGVERVGRAQHDDGRARVPEGRDHVVDGLGGPRVDGVDPPGVQQVAGEPGARGVGGQRAEGREERARPGTGGGEVRVGPSRNASYAAAGRYAGNPPPRPSPRPASRSGPDRGTGFSCRSGNSLTPVTGDRRVAASFSRPARTAAVRSATSPDSSAATTPPAASNSWKNAQAARASSSVRDSTNHEPPAGSITAPGAPP